MSCQTRKKYITAEEKYLIGTLHNSHLKNCSGVKISAMLLCQGSDYIGSS